MSTQNFPISFVKINNSESLCYIFFGGMGFVRRLATILNRWLWICFGGDGFLWQFRYNTGSINKSSVTLGFGRSWRERVKRAGPLLCESFLFIN